MAFPESVALAHQDYQLLQLSEEALERDLPYHVLPIGAWHAKLQQRLTNEFDEGAAKDAA
ncbi:hypothetical protein ACWDBD_41090 [Streptomyces sp. NPDC001118]|uniref:hypothetical protein n=1 Tax=unclassified Streptomyces TaxID=2593676 RepID=UPI003323115B